jgi:molecular chaperone DnaK
MPTVGWIREGDWEAFLEATEPVISLGPPLPPSYPCPFCSTILPSAARLQNHVSAEHHVARPILLVDGKEPTESYVLRLPVAKKSLIFANVTNVQVTINGGTPRSILSSDLASEIAKLKHADVSISLSNASQVRAAPVITRYDFLIRIADAISLKNVELAFSEMIMCGTLTRSTIERFLNDSRCQGPGKDYADGLANFSLGVQFVHEPVAALYAYLRSQPDINRELARLEGRSVLVFDWGGGTLDLTLCRIQGAAIMQIANLGDNEVGGDRFDERLRNFLRTKHATVYGLEDISSLEQPGMAAKVLHQCEVVKIHLSDPEKLIEDVIVKNFLKIDGPARNLVGTVTREELNKESSGIVARGLAKIDEILEQARLSYQDIELCLATGGMVNMPAIRDGLTERFLGRVPPLSNGDRIIAEGAAWIAHDGLRLTLSKPIEILMADTSALGTYYPLVEAGWQLPLENETQHVTNTRLFCTDPREGIAVVELAKPVKIGRCTPTDPRRTLCIASVEVDPNAQPLIERLECHLQIDHDYVANLILRSTGRGDEKHFEFHDLEFGLALPAARVQPDPDGTTNPTGGEKKAAWARAAVTSNLVQRTNIAMHLPERGNQDNLWQFVPGDLVAKWRSAYFDVRSGEATDRQFIERNFYIPCARCRRLESQIKAEGRVSECRGTCGLRANH